MLSELKRRMKNDIVRTSVLEATAAHIDEDDEDIRDTLLKEEESNKALNGDAEIKKLIDSIPANDVDDAISDEEIDELMEDCMAILESKDEDNDDDREENDEDNDDDREEDDEDEVKKESLSLFEQCMKMI